MAEYIFYTYEGYTQDPSGNDVQNCQLMGRSTGDNQREALCNLLDENPWIEEHDFDPDEFICKELAGHCQADKSISYLIGLLDERQVKLFMQFVKTLEK